MKKSLTFYLLNLFILSVLAQSGDVSYDVHWSEPQKLNRYVDFTKYVGSIDGTTFSVFIKRDEVIGRLPAHLFAFDERREEVRMKVLKVKGDKGKLDYERIIQRKSELLLITSREERRAKRKWLYIQKINPLTLEIEGVPREIAQLNNDIDDEHVSGKIHFVPSKDSTRWLIHMPIWDRNKEKKRLALHVFDQDFKLLWQREVVLPFNGELLEIVDCEIGSNGNVYVLNKLYNKKDRDRFKDRVEYSYQLLTYREKEADEQNLRLSVQDNYLKDLLITMDASDNVIGVGLCSRGYKEGDNVVEDIFYTQIAASTGEVLFDSKKKLSSELLTLVENEKENSDELKLRELFVKQNGEIAAIAEYEYIDKVVSSGMRDGIYYSYVSYNFVLKDLFTLTLAPSGELLWARGINKLQEYAIRDQFFEKGKEPLSFLMTHVKNNLYFLFDDPSQIGVAPQYITKNVTGVKIDNAGNVKKLFSTDFDDLETELKVEKSGPLFGNKLLIYGENRKKYCFGSINIE